MQELCLPWLTVAKCKFPAHHLRLTPPKKWMSSISIYLQTWWVQSDVNVAVVSATTKMLVPPLPIWRCATQKPIALPDSHPEVDRISYTYSGFFQNKIRGSFFSMNLPLQDIPLTDPKTNLHCDIRIWNMPIPIPVLMKVRVLWGGGLRKDGWMDGTRMTYLWPYWWFRNPKANHLTCMKPCK